MEQALIPSNNLTENTGSLSTLTLTERDLQEMQNCLNRCLSIARGPHGRFQFNDEIQKVATPAKALLDRHAVDGKINPTQFSPEDRTCLQEYYTQLQKIERKITLHEKVCENNWMDSILADQILGCSNIRFLRRNHLYYGPRNQMDDRILLYDKDNNFIYPTPAEQLFDRYLSKTRQSELELEELLMIQSNETALFSFLYYPTSGSGEFRELKYDIAQHELHKTHYSEKYRFDRKESIEEVLEGIIKKRARGHPDIKVVYNPLEHKFYPDQPYFDNRTRVSVTKDTPIDPEPLGYVNYQPEKHGTIGHFLMRYGPLEWVGELLTVCSGLSSLGLSDEKTIESSCYHTDVEGYTIWERLYPRSREYYYAHYQNWVFMSRWYSVVERNLETFFHCDLLPKNDGNIGSATWCSFRKFYPFFVPNRHSGDNFFHMIFRKMSTPPFPVVNIIPHLSQGWLLHSLATTKNLMFRACSSIINYAHPNERMYLYDHARDIMPKVNLLHGLFTLRNKQGQTPMDFLAEKLLYSSLHKETDYSIELPKFFNRVLGQIVLQYKMAGYDNLLYRIYGRVDKPDNFSYPPNEVFDDDDVDNSLFSPFMDIALQEDKHIDLFRATILGLRFHGIEELSVEELLDVAASYMKNRETYSQKIQDQLRILFKKNQSISEDSEVLFYGIPAMWKEKLIDVLKKGQKDDYITSEEGVQDFLKHLNPSAWGDHGDLAVLAEWCNVKFHLYFNPDVNHRYQAIGKALTPIHLLCLGDQYRLRLPKAETEENRETFTMYLPIHLRQSEKEEDQIKLKEMKAAEERVLIEIQKNNFQILCKKTRFVFRQKLCEITEAFFSKRTSNEGIELPSLFETFLQSHLCRYHRNARAKDCRQVEAEIANNLLMLLYDENTPRSLRKFWLLKTFGNDSITQCNRLKDFIISILYHERRDQSFQGKVAKFTDSRLDFSNVWKGISNGYHFCRKWPIYGEIEQAEKAIEQVFIRSGNNIEIAVHELLETIANTEDVSLCFKKKTDKQILTPLTKVWSAIFQIMMYVIFIIFPNKSQPTGTE